jgi:predicted alpha/beta-hydrolase family hydrolase
MARDVVSFVDDTVRPSVHGMLHVPAAEPADDAIVLTHGAGGTCDAPLLVALAEAFATRGLTVLRCDLPFRQERAHGPPGGGNGARDRAGLVRAIDLLHSRVRGRVFLGGHSYGGRQSSLLAAEQPRLVPGLLLLAYPLHPPGRPLPSRTGHFREISAPALFVHGSRDPFGSADELRQAMAMIPARTSLEVVDGAGHALVPRGGGAVELGRAVASAFVALVG